MPFAGYKNFDECVAKNSEKSDPKAYCATIMRKVEEGMPPASTFITSGLFDVSEAEFHVEESTGELRAKVRILKAGRSKNNRNYRPAAVREAVEKQMFNGVRMFIDHDPTKPPLKRSMRDLVSAIESTTYDEKDQAMDAQVVFFNKEFYDFAQRAKNYMGDSINALVRGTRVRGADGVVEEDIQGFHQPRSVDWVIYPAAGGFIQAFESEEEVDWSQITLEQLKEHAPAILEAYKSEVQESATPVVATSATTVDPAVIAEIVAEKIKVYEAERAEILRKQNEAAEKIRNHLMTTGLPERTRHRVLQSFEGVEEFDQAAVDVLVTEAKEELKAAGASPKITGHGPTNTNTGSDVAAAKSVSVMEAVEVSLGYKPTAPATTQQ